MAVLSVGGGWNLACVLLGVFFSPLIPERACATQHEQGHVATVQSPCAVVRGLFWRTRAHARRCVSAMRLVISWHSECVLLISI